MTARQLADLLDRHSAALVLFARQRCDAAEDAVQEAFCKLATLSAPPDDPAAWLFKVVRNAALDAGKAERRRRRREAVAAKPVRWFHETTLDGLDAAVAVAALQALPDEQREVIVLRLWSDLTLEQIATAVGCSLSTAHRRYEAGVAAAPRKAGCAVPEDVTDKLAKFTPTGLDRDAVLFAAGKAAGCGWWGWKWLTAALAVGQAGTLVAWLNSSRPVQPAPPADRPAEATPSEPDTSADPDSYIVLTRTFDPDASPRPTAPAPSPRTSPITAGTRSVPD